MSDHDYGWRPYVSVATRRRRAAQDGRETPEVRACDQPCHNRGPQDRQDVLGRVVVQEPGGV